MKSTQFFALPHIGEMDRWLVRGVVREEPSEWRAPCESSALMAAAGLLGNWLVTTRQPRGKLFCDGYFRIGRNPDTIVGIDLGLASSQQRKPIHKKSVFIDGPPVIAIEVLSPYDKQKEIDEMIEEYAECRVPLVWIVDPMDETVTVYRPDAEPVLFNRTQKLAGFPELPGFSCSVAEIFE